MINLANQTTEYVETSAENAMDSIDTKMVQLLRADGRMSNADLAAAVGLSASACLRRLRLMERNGTIRGYTALVEEPDGADTMVAIVQVTLERQTEEFLQRFESAVRKCPDIRECYLMTGLEDYILRVDARNAGDYERIHNEQLSRLPGVHRIRSSFAIRSVVRSRPR
jgi:DNA-binding Lrp family transcriptional regulator